MAKKILFVLRQPPYNGAYAQEALDIAMTLAAFDQKVSLLLLDDAVFQLKSGQAPESAGLKNLEAIFQALPLYDIDHIYAEAESLTERGVTLTDLANPVIEINRKTLGRLFKEYDQIISS